MYEVRQSTLPCYEDRTPNPMTRSSKFGLHRLEVGYSVFIPYESSGNWVPYEAGKARMAANEINRKYNGAIKLQVTITIVNASHRLMEIARVK